LIATPRLDLATGAIRVAPATLEVLLAYADDPALVEREGPHAEHLEALRSAELLQGRTLHPDLRAALEPVATPACRLALRHDEHRSRGWVSGAVATLAVPATGGLRDLIRMHPSFLPEALGRLAGLGARPRPPEAATLRIPEPTFERLSRNTGDASDPELRDLSELDSAQAVAVLRHVRGAWGAVARWTNAAGRACERQVEVLDSQEEGLWLVERSRGMAQLAPATTTLIWRRLTELLPRDADLAAESCR